MGFIGQIIQAINHNGYGLLSFSTKQEKIKGKTRDRKHAIDDFSICSIASFAVKIFGVEAKWLGS